jgi:hypothetical protein
VSSTAQLSSSAPSKQSTKKLQTLPAGRHRPPSQVIVGQTVLALTAVDAELLRDSLSADKTLTD